MTQAKITVAETRIQKNHETAKTEDQKITAPEWANYMGDWMEEIPENCVLNKGTTGCGATTLATEQKTPTLIAAPFTELIRNKAAQYPENRENKPVLLPIYGEGDKTKEIADYMEKHGDLPKIMTTYDSVPKVCRILDSLGYDPYGEMHLCVDEWHLLFNQYSFRNRAIRNLLTITGNFERVTYMSATPIERDYWLEELLGLPEYRIEWPHIEPVRVRSHRIEGSPLKYMTGICKDTLKHDSPYNLHIFLNSVEGAKAVIDTLKATPDIARIVCADNDENILKLGGFPRSSTTDPVSRINLYTSTAFDGCDIYDRDGMTFIVSDTMKRHSLIDISTSMIQICGRVRDSRYNEIVHLYDTLPYKDTTFEQFEKATWKRVEEAEEYVQWLNSAPERIKPKIQESISYSDERYIINNGGTYKVDRNMAKYEIFNWKTVNGIYTAGNTVEDEMKKHGIEITNSDSYSEPRMAAVLSQRAKFQDLFERYCEIRENEPEICFNPSIERQMIETKNPLVREAYEKIGAEEVRKMKYHQSNIKRRLIAESQKNFAVKVVEMLDLALKKQTWIPSAKVKSALQKIYDSLGIKKTAKATDIDEWYDVQRSSRYIDGKNTACVMILRKTFISLKNF